MWGSSHNGCSGEEVKAAASQSQLEDRLAPTCGLPIPVGEILRSRTQLASQGSPCGTREGPTVPQGKGSSAGQKTRPVKSRELQPHSAFDISLSLIQNRPVPN